MIIYNVDDIKVGCSELSPIHCLNAAVAKLFVNKHKHHVNAMESR